MGCGKKKSYISSATYNNKKTDVIESKQTRTEKEKIKEEIKYIKVK